MNTQLLAIVAAAMAAAAAAAAATGKAPYEVFVAPGGSDASPGTSTGAPVATLHRARDLLRSAPRPAIVHLAAGSYFLGNRSLSLGPQDGGGVRWQGAPDGGSVVHSGARITGWERHGGGGGGTTYMYRAPWAGPRFFAMTEERRPAALARHPDPGSGYLALTAKNGDTVGWVPGTVPDFRCTEPDQCQAYLQCNYFAEVHNVALGSVNLTTHSLKYEAVPHCTMRMGMGGVYLMGALEFLSAPGEFAIAGGYVYYRPLDASTPIEQLTIVASIPERAVQFMAPSSAAPVSGITLQVGSHTRTRAHIHTQRDKHEHDIVVVDVIVVFPRAGSDHRRVGRQLLMANPDGQRSAAIPIELHHDGDAARPAVLRERIGHHRDRL